MITLAMLADDLTGAADAAGAFASAGFATAIVFGDAPTQGLDVIVRATGSRGLDAGAAREVNARVARQLGGHTPSQHPRWFYKKIDSALRGHPGLELIAVMTALGETRALVAPALPAERRTTVGSRQLIDGTPIEQTVLGASVATSNLRALFAEGGLPVMTTNLAMVRAGANAFTTAVADLDKGILIADAETDADLAAIALGAVHGGIRVLAGSAGFARQLATVLPTPARQAGRAVPAPGNGGVLIVAASQHASTRAQVAALHDAAVPLVRPSQEILDGVNTSTLSMVNEICGHLAEKNPVVVTTSGCERSRLGPAFVASAIAGIVAQVGKREPFGGMVLTGGDVAAAVLERLEASMIELGGEVLPAVPWGRLHSPGMAATPIVTKAGSFGGRDALLRCLTFLRG